MCLCTRVGVCVRLFLCAACLILRDLACAFLQERQETEAHVIYAMRKMLRSHDDMAACAEALAKLSEPVSYYQLKVKAIATGEHVFCMTRSQQCVREWGLRWGCGCTLARFSS